MAVLASLGSALAFTDGQSSQPTRRRVVLVSVDGGAGELLNSYLDRGLLPSDGAFARMRTRGMSARRMIPPNGASTAIAHSVLFTGADPSVTGIVSNNFIDDTDSLGTRAGSQRAFNTRLRVETLWSAAMRQGRRVTCAYAPFADSLDPARSCTRTILRPRGGDRGAVFDLVADSDFTLGAGILALRRREAPPGVPLKVAAEDGDSIPLFAYAVRPSNGGHFLALARKPLGRGLNSLISLSEVPRTYRRFAVPPGSSDSISAELLSLDEDGSAARLYIGPLSAELLRPVDQRREGFPLDIDNRAALQAALPESTLMRQVFLAADQMATKVGRELRRDDWDLTIAYLQLIDDVEHRYLPTSERQVDFASASSELRREREAALINAYRKIDAILSAWMSLAPDADFVVVSDHGMVPTHSVFLPNVALQRAGVRIGMRGEAMAYGDAGNARIHVNHVERAGGTVPADRVEPLIDRIDSVMKQVRDPETGERVVKFTARGAALDSLKVRAPGRGVDLWVAMRPGYDAQGSRDTTLPPVFKSSFFPEGIAKLGQANRRVAEFLTAGGAQQTSPGLHGFEGSEPAIGALFFAVGPRIPTSSDVSASSVDVAPTVSALLGIQPPAASSGRSLVGRPR